MKVVINKCHGGFGISNEAMAKLIKKESDVLDIESLENWSRDSGCPENIEEYCDNRDPKSLDKKKIDGKTYYIDMGVFLDFEDGLYYRLDSYDMETRTHEDLIELVEQMGDNVNGYYSELKIVEIPDDIDWKISEFDGMERIEEKHRSWG